MPVIGGNACKMPPSKGHIQFVSVGNPGALAPIFFTIPPNRCYFWSALYIGAHTGANIGDRYLGLILETDTGKTIWYWKSATAQVANEDLYYTFNRTNGNLNNFHNDILYTGPLPEIWLLPGTVMTIYQPGCMGPDNIYGCRLTFAVYQIH